MAGYRHRQYQKGWSSERVPPPAGGGGRRSGAPLLFGNGRGLPSKWEDAEKWILSPVSSAGAVRASSMVHPQHRRPKSKSGPLGVSASAAGGGVGGCASSSSAAASPLAACFDDTSRVHFNAGSPFLAGVLVPDQRFYGDDHERRRDGERAKEGSSGGGSYCSNSDPHVARSASLHGWSDTVIESSSSFPSSQETVQDEKFADTGEVTAIVSTMVLRKDMATQMSPEESPHSSPDQRLSLTHSSQVSHPIVELENHFTKLEVRDVQVDDQVAVAKWSKKCVSKTKSSKKGSTSVTQWKKKSFDTPFCSWSVEDSVKCVTKYKREEAKITAWENLQKAKAEAAIRKLEMKLEKKRSSSMDKILNKLKLAQRKAQEMRNSVSASKTHQVAQGHRRVSHLYRTGPINSWTGCFTCQAL